MAQIKLRDPFTDQSTTAKLEEKTAPAAKAVGERVGESAIRLSVDLDRSLHRRLRRWALEENRTAAEVVRELLTSALDTAGY